MKTRALLVALLAALGAPFLAAAEDVKLAVSYPSSTVIYLEVAAPEILENLTQPEFLAGLIPGFKAPNMGDLLSSKLELDLKPEEIKALVSGVRRGAGGVLYVAISGPRVQIVIDHKDPAPLLKALAAAAKGNEKVRLAETFEQTPIYKLEILFGTTEETKPGFGTMGPAAQIKKWLAQMGEIWLCVHENRYVVAATSLNAVKDALDFIAFPDDTTDTLLGNARYREALAEFEKPQGLLFVNTNSFINALERITGDNGKAARGMETVQFFVNMVEYKQLKSFAAGYWVDDASGSVRMDARLQFHFTPGWYNAVRAGPREQDLSGYLPQSAIFALTLNIEKPAELFSRGRDFLVERAREAGRAEVLDSVKDMEAHFARDGLKIEDLLAQFSGGMAIAVVPVPTKARAGSVFMLRMKDPAKCQELFYGDLMGKASGVELRRNDRKIEYCEEVEIHSRQQQAMGATGFAFVDGVFVTGELESIKAVIRARKAGSTMAQSPAFSKARGALWDKCSGAMILNYGAVIESLSGVRLMPEADRKPVVEDCTKADEKGSAHLAEFFRNTVVVIGTLGRDSDVVIRYSASGWPSRQQFKGLALLFKNVARNRTARDRLTDIRAASSTYLALKGKPATKAAELADAGYTRNADSILDPYGEDGKLEFKLAPQIDKVDTRQPILLAYQEKAGLRDRHMAVLWSGEVVSLSPEELAEGLERAKKGECMKDRKARTPLTGKNR